MKKRFTIDIPRIKEIENFLIKNPHILAKENTDPTITYETIKENLGSCIRKEGENIYIDAQSIRKIIFPHHNVDVFISHAHVDHYHAVILKLYIENNLGLKAFLDFQCWGYKEHLQELINNEYSLFPDRRDLYILERTNSVATNVDMILNRALLEVISAASYFIIIASDNSIPNSFSNRSDALITQSPWIHNEVAYVNTLFKEARIKSATLNENLQNFSQSRTIFEHDLAISDFEMLDLSNISQKLSKQ